MRHQELDSGLCYEWNPDGGYQVSPSLMVDSETYGVKPQGEWQTVLADMLGLGTVVLPSIMISLQEAFQEMYALMGERSIRWRQDLAAACQQPTLVLEPIEEPV